MDTGARTRIIQLFEKYRATPGAPYDEAHFLDFLLANPKGKGAVSNSFRGLRRFNAFVDDVQYEFGICFSLDDREANHSLDKFVERTLQLQQSRRGSLKSLNNQIKAGVGWQVLVVADIILLIAMVWLKDNVWALAAVGSVAVVANGWFSWFAWKAKTYLVKLRTRIEAPG